MTKRSRGRRGGGHLPDYAARGNPCRQARGDARPDAAGPRPRSGLPASPVSPTARGAHRRTREPGDETAEVTDGDLLGAFARRREDPAARGMPAPASARSGPAAVTMSDPGSRRPTPSWPRLGEAMTPTRLPPGWADRRRILGRHLVDARPHAVELPDRFPPADERPVRLAEGGVERPDLALGALQRLTPLGVLRGQPLDAPRPIAPPHGAGDRLEVTACHRLQQSRSSHRNPPLPGLGLSPSCRMVTPV